MILLLYKILMINLMRNGCILTKIYIKLNKVYQYKYNYINNKNRLS